MEYKLGELVEQVTETNSELNFGLNDIVGVTIDKKIIPTIANLKETDLKKFVIVSPNDFIYNPRTHGKRIGLGYNNTDRKFIATWNNNTFRIKEEKRNTILSDYLYLYFSREIWDKEACFNSWGSSTVVFSWDSFCDMKINLPDIKKKKKIVKEYQVILNNKNIIEKENTILESLAYTIYTETIENCTEWLEINLGISTKTSAGGDNPSDTVLEKTEKCKIPVYSNGVTADGLFGYTSKAKINEESITISARGTIGFTAFRMQPYTPIVRLISSIPNDNNIIEFLYMHFKYLKYDDDGSVQKQATKPYFEAMNINIPRNVVKFKNKIRPILKLIENNKQKCKLLEKILSLRLSTI